MISANHSYGYAEELAEMKERKDKLEAELAEITRKYNMGASLCYVPPNHAPSPHLCLRGKHAIQFSGSSEGI